MRGRFRLTLVLTVLTGSVGCAYKPSALPVRQISEYDNVVVHQEVALAAEPFDRATSRAILGQSVHRKGFAPILVVLKNDGDQRAIVDSDRITLVDSEGQTREWVSTEVVLRKCRKNVPFACRSLGRFGRFERRQLQHEDGRGLEREGISGTSGHRTAHVGPGSLVLQKRAWGECCGWTSSRAVGCAGAG